MLASFFVIWRLGPTFDQAKFEFAGPGACAALNTLRTSGSKIPPYRFRFKELVILQFVLTAASDLIWPWKRSRSHAKLAGELSWI